VREVLARTEQVGVPGLSLMVGERARRDRAGNEVEGGGVSADAGTAAARASGGGRWR
jgi:hypothetical protein